MNSYARMGLAAIFICAICGCATKAPTYQSSLENIQTLQGLGQVKSAVGIVKLDEKNGASLDKLGARGTSVESPYGGYAEYLKEALQVELTTSGKYDSQSHYIVNAVLTKNDLSAAGIITNNAEVAARFSVLNGIKVLYDKELAVKHEWESSFMGAIAIPRAIQNYVVAVQKLVGRLFSDADFKLALTP